MKLRDHPKVSDHWPPTWAGSYGKGTKIAYAEEPEKFLSFHVVGQDLFLECEYEGNRCTGLVTIEDEEFREKLIKELEKHTGKSIREVGSLEIDF